VVGNGVTRTKMAKSMSARVLVVALAIVICLTLLSRVIESNLFFFLLYPGVVLSLLITGGHGGTRAEEATASVLSFIVNTFCYYLLCATVLVMSGHTGAKRAS
jgi:hypothetical protein